MPLRQRITLFVAITLVAMACTLFVAAHLRERALDGRFHDRHLASQSALWQQFLQHTLTDISGSAAAVLKDDELIAAVQQKDKLTLTYLAPALLTDITLNYANVRLDLLSDDGEALFSTAVSPSQPAPLIGSGLARKILAERKHLHGVRADTQGNLMATVFLPLTKGAKVIGAAIVGVDLAAPLRVLGRQIDAGVYAINRSGRLLTGPPDARWSAINAGLDLAKPQIAEVEHDNRRFQVSSLLVADLTGGRVGNVILAEDVTAMAQHRQLWTRTYIIFSAVTVLVALGLVAGFLRLSFEPLRDLVSALSDLTHGRMPRYTEFKAGDDEIGRIGAAVTVFRERLFACRLEQDRPIRRRARQIRYIRRELEALAARLDGDTRRAILADIDSLTAPADTAAINDDLINEDLGLTGVALSRVAARVVEQHARAEHLLRALSATMPLSTPSDIARALQRALPPAALPRGPALDLSARLEPALPDTAGDLYDVFTIDDRRLGILLVDVSGRGLPAALWALMVQGSLRALDLASLGPGAALTRLNERLCDGAGSGRFAAVLYGDIDRTSGVFVYATAGHEPPVLMRRSGTAIPLEPTAGPVLGVFPGEPVGEARVTLSPGDALVLASDGVASAARLAKALRAAAPETADDLLAQALRVEAGGMPGDDRACVTLVYRGDGARPGEPTRVPTAEPHTELTNA